MCIVRVDILRSYANRCFFAELKVLAAPCVRRHSIRVPPSRLHLDTCVDSIPIRVRVLANEGANVVTTICITLIFE